MQSPRECYTISEDTYATVIHGIDIQYVSHVELDIPARCETLQ